MKLESNQSDIEMTKGSPIKSTKQAAHIGLGEIGLTIRTLKLEGPEH